MPDHRLIIGPSFQLLSNWCSMGCAGCGIHVAPPPGHDVVALGERHLANARKTLRFIKDTLDGMGFQYGMVEQSGGEPTHHPQIVEAVGEVFEDSVHKIITNGLPTASIHDYLKRRGEKVFLVMSVDHHKVEFNRVRLGGMLVSEPDRAAQMQTTILRNLDLFVTSDVPVVVSTIVSKWNIAHYLGFLEWLEEKYPRQIQNGMLVPIPVSLVSFGNPGVGKLNPSAEQVCAFEEAVRVSDLLTVKRGREWLFGQLIGHYRNKQRFFEGGESLDQIALHPSRYPCEIFRHMISFNFQDEEILRPSADALFQGYACGVKVLGNIGYALNAQGDRRLSEFRERPSNMQSDRMYYRVDQVAEYVDKKERVINDREAIRMGDRTGCFSDLRRGMCLLDDFDGVWWPLNVYLQGIVDDVTLGEYWSLFRNTGFMKTLRQLRDQTRSVSDGCAART